MKNPMKKSIPALAKYFALNALSASLLLTIGNSSIACTRDARKQPTVPIQQGTTEHILYDG